MKSLLMAVTVFAVIIAICGASYFAATDFAKDMLDDLYALDKHLADGDTVAAAVVSKRCISRTETANPYMAAIANHGELGSMKSGILEIAWHTENGEISAARLNVAKTKELFLHFYNSEKFKFENIF